MKLGIFARTFVRATLDQVLASVRQHGFSSVQFNLRSAGLETVPATLTPEQCREIHAGFARHGLEMDALSGTFNAIHPDVGFRREQIERCRRLIAAAPRLGTRIVSLCSGSRDASDMWCAHLENAGPDAWRDLVATLEALLPAAESHGVVLGIEPEPSNVVHSAAAARRLLDQMRSRHLKIILDGANLFQPGEPPWAPETLERACNLLGPDVVVAHIKKLGAIDECRMGWSRYVTQLRRSGFAGPVIVHDVPEPELPAAIKFLTAVI